VNVILDTNVVSELRKAGDGKANPALLAWLAQRDATTLYVSAITILELERGILQKERRDPTQGAMLRTWMDRHVRPAFANRILPIDDAVATRCAGLHVPDRRNEADALIAATGLVLGMTVATGNIKDFASTGVPLVDPWGHSD
jgi:toxin FitB